MKLAYPTLPKPTSFQHLHRTSLAFLTIAALSLGACRDKREPQADITTAETLKAQTQVNNYAVNNSEEQKKKVAVAFAALDQEIRELEVRVEATTGNDRALAMYKLVELKKRRSEIQSDYNEAKFDALINDIKNSVR
jgi:hypothetical protein